MGESTNPRATLRFDRRVRLEFRGATITSDAGLLACRELDDALGLTETANECLQESRGGRNVQHRLVDLLRQSVYSRLAGYEDTNDAERLAQDPTMRVVVGRRGGPERPAASTNTMSRFETEVLTQDGIASVHSLLVLRGEIQEEVWELVCSLAEMVIENWRSRDRGVWEVRGEEQHFVYSKVLCWAALDTAAYIAAAVEQRRHYRRWSQTAFVIKTEVLDLGWSESKRAFRQRYDSDALDASNLAIPFFGLIPAEDPRVRQNLDAIERELAEGPLVWRYIPEETDDGLEAQPEGTFTLLSFWLLGNLIYTGQTDKAFDLFHETITRCSNLSIARTYGPVVARVIEPPCGPVDGLLSPLGLRVKHLLSVEQGPVG